jgi:hypothetical protein
MKINLILKKSIPISMIINYGAVICHSAGSL